MGSPGASTSPIRETVGGEVFPLVAADQALVAMKVWDLDSVINTFTSTEASEVFKIPIPADIDPEGDYAVRTDIRSAPSPPIPTPIPVDVPVLPEPVDLLLLRVRMRIHHERSLEEPPAPFVEGEDVDEVESEEDETGGSTPPEPLVEQVQTVAAGNLATFGLTDEGSTLAPVLEPYVPARPAKK